MNQWRILIAFLLSFGLEMTLAISYAKWKGRQRPPFVTSAIIGNIISLLYVWFITYICSLYGGLVIGLVLLAIFELIAVFWKALLYTLFSAEPYGHMLLLSLLANLLSLGVGLLIH
jgi:hypothetical protein